MPRAVSESRRAWLLANADRLRQQARDRRSGQSDKVRANAKAWRAANPEKVERYRVQQAKANRRGWLKTYGLTPETYTLMFEAQLGLCACCGRASTKNLCVDHCHTTGKIRGLLCSGCNVGIGNFEDRPEHLRSAASYLERSRG